ncbi:MAG: RusA family crossover junction endodeoxyribonuclease [Bacteroidota bacterium]|jgi:crossover junction endodeoxyribonuclease RusA
MPNIDLPFPPSMNHYWRRVGARTIISRAGREFREEVIRLTRDGSRGSLDGPIAITIEAHPPDRRRRDLDNLLKAPLDAMAHAGLYLDDHQIEEIHLYRRNCCKNGKLVVSLEPQGGSQQADSCDLRAELEQRANELRQELTAVMQALEQLGG